VHDDFSWMFDQLFVKNRLFLHSFWSVVEWDVFNFDHENVIIWSWCEECFFEVLKRRTKGGSEWEPIKILLDGDRDSNKMNSTSNTRLRLNYPSWSSATDPRNQQTTFRAKTHKHAQRKLARLAACATPVRLVNRAGQAGGYSSCTTNVPESLSDFSRP
jgi:hypothetical protein